MPVEVARPTGGNGAQRHAECGETVQQAQGGAAGEAIGRLLAESTGKAPTDLPIDPVLGEFVVVGLYNMATDLAVRGNA